MERALLFVCILASTTVADAAIPSLTATEKASLDEGEVVIREHAPRDGRGVAFTAMGLIRATPATVWPVLRDCGRFQEFMPRTEKSEMRNRVGNTVECFTQIDMPFPFDDLWCEVKVTETAHSETHFARSWTLKKGTYEWNDGSWTLYPWRGGEMTLMVYRLEVNPQVSVPDFLIRKGQTGALPDLYEALNRRVR